MLLRHFDSSDRSPLNSVPLEQLRDTSSSPTIAPHQSSSYPEYLSPTWDKKTQQAVVWTRLHRHCKLARQSLTEIGERYKALRQEQSTRVESRHKPSSRDNTIEVEEEQYQMAQDRMQRMAAERDQHTQRDKED